MWSDIEENIILLMRAGKWLGFYFNKNRKTGELTAWFRKRTSRYKIGDSFCWFMHCTCVGFDLGVNRGCVRHWSRFWREWSFSWSKDLTAFMQKSWFVGFGEQIVHRWSRSWQFLANEEWKGKTRPWCELAEGESQECRVSVSIFITIDADKLDRWRI